jgi:phage repressor protein C with HTH and peptisase S24 domain
MNDVVRKLILEKLAEKRLSMKAASLRLGKSHSYIQQYLKRGVPGLLDEDVRGPLAEMLGVDEDLLRGPSSKLPKREYVKAVPSTRESLIVPPEQATLMFSNEQKTPGMQPGALLVGERDLPVFGTAQGGRGALIVTDRAVDWVVRPNPLLRVVDGYGMIVTGDSMSPEHKPGSIALVNPHLPPRTGDTCVFRSHADDGTVHAVIKELRGSNDDVWKVHQHNPKRDYTLKKSEWQICHKTVGNFFA